MPHKVYRDTETGEFVSESTYRRSMAHGGSRYEAIDAPDIQDNPDVVFGSLDDLFYDDSEYDDYEELVFDGGADYGEE